MPAWSQVFKKWRLSKPFSAFKPRVEEAPALPVLPRGSSIQERKVAGELNRRNEVWEPQQSFNSGRAQRGGFVVDFYLQNRNLVIRVMGEYWHANIRSGFKDDAQAILLIAQGIQVVDIWEDEIDDDVRAAVSRALGDWK